MRCSDCQQALEDNAAFCTECGKPQFPERTCVNCGQLVKAGKKFCANCGKSPDLTCSRCRSSLQSGQKFCKRCGLMVQQQVPRHTCNVCGARLEDESNFCPECGNPIPYDSSLLSTAILPTDGQQEDEQEKEADVKDTKASTDTELLAKHEYDEEKEKELHSLISKGDDLSSDQVHTSSDPVQLSSEPGQTCSDPRQASSVPPIKASDDLVQVFSDPVHDLCTPLQESCDSVETDGPKGFSNPALVCIDPLQASSFPIQTIDKPTQTSEEAAQTSHKLKQPPSELTQTYDRPVQPHEGPAEKPGEPAQTETTVESAQTPGESAQTPNEPAQPPDEPAQTPDEPAQPPGAAASASAVDSTSDGNAEMVDSDGDDSGSQGEEVAERDDRDSQHRDHRKRRGAAQRRNQNRRQTKSKQQKAQDKKQQQAAAEKQHAHVMFHVVISTLFKEIAANNHKVFLSWAPDGSEPSPSNKIEVKRTERAGHGGRLYEVMVEASQLLKSQVIKYKYGVELNGRFEWEKLYFEKGDKSCRKLHLPGPQIFQKGPFDIYDWMAYPHGMMGFVDSFKRMVPGAMSFRVIFAQDLKLSSALFLPTPDMVITALSSQEIKAEHMIHRILDLARKAIASETVTEQFMTAYIAEFVLWPLMNSLENAVNQSQSTVALAVFQLCLFEGMGWCPTCQQAAIICRALLIKPDLEKKMCPEIQHLHSHFPRLMKTEGELWKKCEKLIIGNLENSLDWIYPLPLLHLVCGQCKQFQSPVPEENHRKPEWWGTSYIDDTIQKFKNILQRHGDWITKMYEDVYGNLSAALKADPLMMRTFVAVMNLDQVIYFLMTIDLPSEIVMASLFYHLNTAPEICRNRHKDIVQILRNTVDMTRVTISSMSQVTEQEKKYYTMLGAICDDLLKEVIETHRCEDAVIHEVVVLQLSIMTMLARPGQWDRMRNKAIMDNVKFYTEKWLQRFHCQTLQHWEQLEKIIEECLKTSAEIQNHQISNDLKQFFLNLVKHHLERLDPVTRLTACIKLMEREDSMNSVIGEDMHAYLEQAFAEVAYLLVQERHKIEHFLQRGLMILQTHVSNLFKAKCSKKVVHSRSDKLALVLLWKPMLTFLHCYTRQQETEWQTWVNSEVSERVAEIYTFLENLYCGVIEGHILVSDLQWLLQDDRNSRFREVLNAVGKDGDKACEALSLRQKELRVFQNIAHDVTCLLRICQEFITTGDARTELENFIIKSGNLDKNKITDICKNPENPAHVRAEDYMPTVHIEAVPERFRPFLPQIPQRQKSAVFCNILKRCAGAMNISPDSKFWEVLVSVWYEAEREWILACDAMRKGNITVTEIRPLFSVIEKNEKWMEKCTKEMRYMCGDGSDDWVDMRMQQFLCLSRMSTQREAADILRHIKEEFKFSGDVENIRSFQEVDVTTPIGQLDLKVVGTSQALQYIDDESVKYFRQFGSQECSKFVSWVRDTMAGDGMKELKVFVDLALNYVGDDPREMDKIRNLRAVITGYAPLIFPSSSNTSFLDCCCEVVRNIQADKDLPSKLASTVSLVQWFDTIHKFHGAVEKTAMAQVDSITSRGILKVGCLRQTAHSGMGLAVSDVMCLEVPEGSEEEDKGRTYSYQDLLDLQSRLMLVVGPEDQERTNVDRFISVMDSVVRLVRAYIQLCQNGCLLFLDWTVKFFFDQACGVCSIIEFNHEGKVRQLKGLQDTQQGQTLEQYMAMVAEFLDTSSDSWLKYVGETRAKSEELNVYTMDQLVFLQAQLADRTQRDISPQVFSLLSLLHTQCSPEALQTAIEQADDMMDKDESLEDDVDENAQMMAEFIQHMEDNGFSRKLAVRALKDGVNPSELYEGIAWCVDHCEEEEEESFGTAENRRNLSASTLTLNASMMEGTIATALQLLDTLEDKALCLNTVKTRLEDTWTLFLDRVSFSGEDYLSLKHIGCVLTALTMQGALEVDRKMQPTMNSQSPNLIVCPKSEVLKTVTSLYMFSEEAPLPLPDEVLLCTPQTTIEQISMFLQRAFSAKPRQMQKIHCLAYADYLHYDVGQFADQMLKEFINTTDHPYQLVVVCTEENEFNSGLTASLERYSRPAPIGASDTQALASYLHKKFTVPEDYTPSPAAQVDPDRLCVRVVKSSRSGMGKTLYVKRLISQLKTLLEEEETREDSDDEDDGTVLLSEEEKTVHVSVPLYGKHVSSHHVADTLLHRLPPGQTQQATIIHLDIAYEVQEGVDQLLYSLLVLGCVTDIKGHVWRRSMEHLYLLEAMPLLEYSESKSVGAFVFLKTTGDRQEQKNMHEIFSILPSTRCSSPSESLTALKSPVKRAGNDRTVLLDKDEYRSPVFQQAFHYLKQLGHRRDPETFKPQVVMRESQSVCLETLIRHCGVKNPSWSELHHFLSFFNKQLEDFEHSIFCSSELAEDLPGFRTFVLKFLIHMSKDFATHSLNMAEESLPVLQQAEEDDEHYAADTKDIEQFQMRRTWESSPHPYIFFNPDHTSMTFLGFTVDPGTGNLINQAGQVLEVAIMRRALYRSLVENGAPLSEDFDSLDRGEKLLRLYQVMGVPEEERRNKRGVVVDPDDSYELTTDNAKKIMAIYMRFRCNIPVIVMGETGCGKTRLVQFLCALQTPKIKNPKTMVIMKVHGGTTSEDIHKKVKEAEVWAAETKKSLKQSERPLYTVLFFDEANTTEAIGAIKEVMCDRAMNGIPIQLHNDLKMVAACNPYRKHSREVLEHLEKAGLGYHVSAEKTCDKLGRVPMRQLVYRVQPLPQSMLPLVWDFGQLTPEVEHMYIAQMVRQCESKQLFGDLTRPELDTLCKVLVECQAFKRNRKDECSIVSLRDADRALKMTSWFLKQNVLLTQIQKKLRQEISDITKSLVLALSVCYRAGLPDKKKFEEHVRDACEPHFSIRGRNIFRLILESCQDALLSEVKLGEKIARNQALKENVFMMVMCVELRIPLFLVGKPGSSKSLAKTIVADAMQGQQNGACPIFSSLKEVQMVSFQCSPLATADSILNTFRQCAQLQKDKDINKFVAVAVLDEVGLAEDSPHMPLKALHPLLEDGYEIQEDMMNNQADEDQQFLEHTEHKTAVTGDDEQQTDLDTGDEEEDSELDEELNDEEQNTDTESVQQEQSDDQGKRTRMEKVAFIGISNWALDPAKMNRGILVQRDVPDKEELVKTAISICQSGSKETDDLVKNLVPKLAEAYQDICERNLCQREFFGLRDFYSLVKMIHTTSEQKRRMVTKAELQAAVRRNFGGLHFDPMDVFEKHLDFKDLHKCRGKDDIDSSFSALLHMALSGERDCGEGRYLLLLTENYGGLRILTDTLLTGRPVEPIFGSSFPRDQEYTQICRNINRIKICMETGKTVILLNLDNLYESLYDALNQYYSYLSNARYVDLGLGTHRVKCKVDTKFRLIVVAEKQTVYDKFPIPLINRLEKHFLTVKSLLTEKQEQLQQQLQQWVTHVLRQGSAQGQLKENDMWIGYHQDTVSSLVLMAWEKNRMSSQTFTPDLQEKILEECKRALLWCATPDGVIRSGDAWCNHVYFEEQQHSSLAQYLQHALLQPDSFNHCLMAQVTTHSKLLTDTERGELERQLCGYSFSLLPLQAFHTEQQFRHHLSLFLDGGERGKKVLLIQCERGHVNQSLLQCAQYCIQSLWAYRPYQHVLFLVQLPRVTTTPFSGYIVGHWRCVHLDDLRNPPCDLPSVSELKAVSPAQLLASALTRPAESEELEEKEGGDHTVATQGLSLEFVQHLLAASVQNAVSRIQDGNTNSSRAEHRIAILLQWLNNKEKEAFLHGVLQLVCDVMTRKEADSGEHVHPSDWLTQHAAKPDSIKKAGTMRRSWQQCLEREVVPVLAGVVAYVDINHNLDLLQAEGGWLLDMWLYVLNHPDLCHLHHAHLQALRPQLQQFPCHSMFGENSSSPALPFSWILLEVIEGYMAHPTAQPEKEVNVGKEVDNCILGQYLQKAMDSDDKAEDFVMRYLADLVHYHFRPQPAQLQLLVQCVKKAMDQEGVVVVAYRLSTVLVKVHQVMVSVSPRLQALLDMAACHPLAIQNLHDSSLQLKLTRPELVEDILLLKILAEELTPQKNQLNTDNGCRQWLDHFNTLAPVLSGVLEDTDVYCIVGLNLYGDVRDRPARHEKKQLAYGQWCRETITSVRCLWTRVMTVKLFIDFMTPLGENGSVRIEPLNYILLWTLLKEDASMKTSKTLDGLDEYLRLSNSKMVKHLLGDVGKCCHCEIKLEGPPTELHCGHRVCNRCYIQEVRTHQKCPECHKQMPDNFQPDSSGCCDKKKVAQLVSYQQQTSAFLMAVISQLAFGGCTPPQPQAVEHIFSYIIRRVEGVTTIQTQRLTLRNDQMDPSPVLRSFILRLLLKHSGDEVSEHISRYLEDAKQAIKEHVGGNDHQSSSVLRELSLLIIHCVENLEHEREVTGVAERTLSNNFAEKCLRFKDSMHQVRIKLESSPLELSTLTALGQLRYALSMCAAMLHSHVLQAAEGGHMNIEFKDLMMEAAIICTMGSSRWPKLFLVKQLCRQFGLQAYLSLVQEAETQSFLRWLKLDEMQQVEAVPDRYLLCGSEYQAVREEITRRLRNQDDQLPSYLTGCGLSRQQQEYLVMLALHREVSMAVVNTDQNTQVSLTKRAVRLIQSGAYPVDKDFAVSLVRKELGVLVDDHHNLADQSLVCILNHFWLALRSCQQRHHLLATFLTLVQKPDDMQYSFLPTMPQDNVDDIIRAMNIDPTKTMEHFNRGVEIPKLWECPRGHRYVIGDCGNPNAQGLCPECGVLIGGAHYHVPAAENQIAQMSDRTQPGHILGAATDRSNEAIPERSMSAAECCLVRFFTHATLYLSAVDQAASVSRLIHPAVEAEHVLNFLWAHLNKDIQVVQKVMGRPSDDVYLLLHHLCHQMAVLEPVHFWRHTLTTKQDREKWEKTFSDKYIQPVLQQAAAIIQSGYNLQLADTSQGQKQLLNVVFEVGEEDQELEGQDIQCTPAAWKYRLCITVDQFFTEFQLQQRREKSALPVLELFIQQSHHLRALYYVPDILALQHRLLHQLHHRFSRTQAATTLIKDLLHTKEGPDLQKLVAAFSKAWDIIRDFLVSYRCCTESGSTVSLPEEYRTARVGEDSPVAMVLPDSQGPGRCAYLLTHYLLVQHNHFLTLYCPHTTRRYEDLPEVQLSDLSHRHLVSYSPEADLLPLVLGHCDYSLHLGHTDTTTSATKLHYDFSGFELQLRNTLLLSKSRVHRQENGAMQIQTLTYCADSTTSRLFSTLRQKIPQEVLDSAVQRQIAAELGDRLEDMCSGIDNINTTLTFLMSVHISPEQSLHSFMVDSLRMKDTDTIHSHKAQQQCRVKHVQCLWLLLCAQRARILALNNQEAFDQQGMEIRSELTKEQKTAVTAALQRLSPDRVQVVLSSLYQVIMLTLIPLSQDHETASPDNFSVKWGLEDNVDNPVYTRPHGEQAQDELCKEELHNFPDSVLASQAIPCWIHVLQHLAARQA